MGLVYADWDTDDDSPKRVGTAVYRCNGGVAVLLGSDEAIWGSVDGLEVSIVVSEGTLTVTAGGAEVSVEVGQWPLRVGLLSHAGYMDRFRIESFKAWVDGIPEPPDDESGHGTYADGEYTYTDKYHAGGTYNPNA
jgi:hypothetical protein